MESVLSLEYRSMTEMEFWIGLLYMCCVPELTCNFHSGELKQTTTAMATRTSPNKRFNEQNNSSACAFEVLVHFQAVLYKRTT